MALFLDVGPDDQLRIGDTIVTLERKSGKRARLKIVGPDEVEMTQREPPQPPNGQVVDNGRSI